MLTPTAPAALPPAERAALGSMVSRFGLGEVLLDLAATAEGVASESDDLRAMERRGEVARKLLCVAVAAERLRL